MTKPRAKGALLRALQIAVTVGALVWIFSTVDLEDLRDQFFRPNLGWLALGLLMTLLMEILGAIRWWIFLRIENLRISLWRATEIFFIGLFFNLFLLGTVGGDTIRAAYVMREEPDRKLAAMVSVVMDRLSGLVALVVFAGFFTLARFDVFSRTPFGIIMLEVTTLILIASVAGLVAAFWLSGKGHQLPEADGRWGWLRPLLEQVVEACRMVRRGWAGSLVANLLSFPVMLTYILSFDFSARAFRAGVTTFDMFAIMPVVSVITSIPISIAGLGVREKIFEELLMIFAGVPNSTSYLVSLGGFSFSVFWGLVGAVIFILYRSSRGGHGVSELRNAVESAEEVTPIAGKLAIHPAEHGTAKPKLEHNDPAP